MFAISKTNARLAALAGKTKILVVGDIMTDVIARPHGPINKGSDQRADIETHAGGSAANQAAWMAREGVTVGLVAKVGRQDVEEKSYALAREGITSHLAACDEASSGVLVTLVDPDGQRSFLCDRGANDFLDIGDLPDQLLDGVSLLHVSGYSLFAPRSRQAVLDFMARAGSAGIAISIDPASVAFLQECGASAFLSWTCGALICFPNSDEAAALTGTADKIKQRQILTEHFPIVVLKCGSDGAEVCGAGGTVLASAPAPFVPVVDTTGAGDAFLAAFISALMRGADLQAAVEKAVANGSLATQFFGGRPPFGIDTHPDGKRDALATVSG